MIYDRKQYTINPEFGVGFVNGDIVTYFRLGTNHEQQASLFPLRELVDDCVSLHYSEESRVEAAQALIKVFQEQIDRLEVMVFEEALGKR